MNVIVAPESRPVAEYFSNVSYVNRRTIFVYPLPVMTTMIYTRYGFAVFFFITWICLWILHLIALFYSRWKLHRPVAAPSLEVPLPGVSILKPLLGDDPNLSSNLETFFTMKYPLYEVLFCVEDEKDPAAAVAGALMARYPNVPARLLVGGERVGVNPKVNNMQPGLTAARHELLLISDAGIRMKEDTLLDMVQHLTERVGLVHQMPFVADRPGFAAALEKVYFGTAQARMYLAADFLRINCHTGMSSLVRRSAFEACGGLAAVADYLAEDFFLAAALRAKGWRLAVSSQPAMQNPGRGGVRALASRLMRWAQLRSAMVPHTILLEPISECLVLGVCAAWATHTLLGWEPAAVLATHALVWFLLDWLLLCAAQAGPPPFPKWWFALAWLLRELAGPVLLLLALCRPTVQWRARQYRLAWGGLATEICPKAKY